MGLAPCLLNGHQSCRVAVDTELANCPDVNDLISVPCLPYLTYSQSECEPMPSAVFDEKKMGRAG